MNKKLTNKAFWIAYKIAVKDSVLFLVDEIKLIFK